MPGWPWWRKAGATAPASRFIWLNSADHTEEHAAFRGNVVYTTKYNLATFLPKALFEQYRSGPLYSWKCFVSRLLPQPHNCFVGLMGHFGLRVQIVGLAFYIHNKAGILVPQLPAGLCPAYCCPAQGHSQPPRSCSAVQAPPVCGLCRRLANMYFTLVAAISTTSISPVR